MARTGSARGLAWLPLLYLAVFFVVPTAIVVSFSFLTRDFYGLVVREWSLQAWSEALDRVTLILLLRSVTLSLAVTLAAIAIGYPCALFASRCSVGWRRLFVALIAFPLATSLLLRIYGWMNLLPIEWRGNLTMVAVVMTVNYLPFMILPILRACERIDPALPQAALDLGATPWKTFWHVTLPLTRPGLLAGCALVFIPCAGEYLVPHFIGEGKVDVLGTEIVKQFMERRNWPFAAACAVWLLALVGIPAVLMALRGADSMTRVDAAKGTGNVA